ncbi:MAG: hypothetical protein FWH46_01330 [Methanimicrococcus sp.]|nr:hypothetical protein [Methanimicrococcus sp.]
MKAKFESFQKKNIVAMADATVFIIVSMIVATVFITASMIAATVFYYCFYDCCYRFLLLFL